MTELYDVQKREAYNDQIKRFHNEWKSENEEVILTTVEGKIATKLLGMISNSIPFLSKDEQNELLVSSEPLLIAVAPSRIILDKHPNPNLDTASDKYIGREMVEEAVVRYLTPRVIYGLARKSVFFSEASFKDDQNLALINASLVDNNIQPSPEVLNHIVRYTLTQDHDSEAFLLQIFSANDIDSVYEKVGLYFNRVDLNGKNNLAGNTGKRSLVKKMLDNFASAGVSSNGIVLLNSETISNFIAFAGVFMAKSTLSHMSADNPLLINAIYALSLVGSTMPLALNASIAPMVIVHECLHHLIRGRIVNQKLTN